MARAQHVGRIPLIAPRLLQLNKLPTDGCSNPACRAPTVWPQVDPSHGAAASHAPIFSVLWLEALLLIEDRHVTLLS